MALTPEQSAHVESILNTVDWSSVPADVRADLEAAALAGVSDAVAGGDVSSAAVINVANQAARDYAVGRSAELVGMKYDVNGNLIENPNAEWAISDSTRDQLREILTQSFEQETPMEDLLSQIDDAGIFSPARAKMIARTEVNQAEIGGNIDAWKQMGGDDLYDWMTGPHPCDQCREYAEEGPYTLKEIEDIMDEVHPNCSCGPVPHIEEDEES